ncbi:MAG: hypothetical protein JRE47_11315 [Deltaproteobacteria bacterium]|nr:hypothetical protein [Deltaproteobacteria bacterium]
MSVRGAIYYKPAFKFHDGGNFDKLILLLNAPSNNNDYLFVPTTSQQKIRSKTVGCVKHYSAGEFFIPKRTTALKLDTWIILAELYPIPATLIQNNPEYIRLREITLSLKLMNKIIDCLFMHHSDDILEMYEALLRPKCATWKQQLAQKFNT